MSGRRHVMREIPDVNGTNFIKVTAKLYSSYGQTVAHEMHMVYPRTEEQEVQGVQNQDLHPLLSST